MRFDKNGVFSKKQNTIIWVATSTILLFCEKRCFSFLHLLWYFQELFETNFSLQF